MLDVAVIIVSWNVREYLTNCLRSLYGDLVRSQLNGAVWVVDNASTDGTVDVLNNLFPQTNVIVNRDNKGFGGANNQGLEAASAYNPRYYFFLNPDTVIQSGAIRHLVTSLDERPDAGMAGARLVYGDGRFQHSAFSFPGITQLVFDLFPMPDRLYESRLNGRYPYRCYRPEEPPFVVDHPLGASMMVRANVAEVTGGFDESYHMYCEEIDWSWRIHEAGWNIYLVPSAEIIHYGGQSTRQIPARSVLNLWRSRAQLYQRHHGRFTNSLATWLVKRGMQKRAAKTKDPELSQAYQEVISVWSGGGNFHNGVG